MYTHDKEIFRGALAHRLSTASAPLRFRLLSVDSLDRRPFSVARALHRAPFAMPPLVMFSVPTSVADDLETTNHLADSEEANCFSTNNASSD
jgi:hypothetical protein